MKINLNEIIKVQKSLDEYIEQKHNLKSIDLIKRKKLALIIELSELCNEIRCFKYWSIKPISSKEKILDEFVDCLHFILSIGLFYGVDSFNKNINFNNKKNNIELSNYFIKLISDVTKIKSRLNSEDFILNLFQLGFYLNLTFDEILNSYYKKNKLNFSRQNSNY